MVVEKTSQDTLLTRVLRERVMPEEPVLIIIKQLLYFVKYLESNSLVHGNLSPSSIIFTELDSCQFKVYKFYNYKNRHYNQIEKS
jgi:serine/threonine protein kinase